MELGQSQRVALRIGVLIVACTILLTGSFVGLLAAISGVLQDTWVSRVPWYLVVGAAVFVGTIILLEINDADGRTIIVTAGVFGTLAFLLVSLGIEGYIYTYHNPDQILQRLILYFVAASLVATGVGYWGLRHWREFTAQQAESL